MERLLGSLLYEGSINSQPLLLSKRCILFFNFLFFLFSSLNWLLTFVDGPEAIREALEKGQQEPQPLKRKASDTTLEDESGRKKHEKKKKSKRTSPGLDSPVGSPIHQKAPLDSLTVTPPIQRDAPVPPVWRPIGPVIREPLLADRLAPTPTTEGKGKGKAHINLLEKDSHLEVVVIPEVFLSVFAYHTYSCVSTISD